MGHSFNTKKTKATFEHPFSDSQISMHFSGLEHATSFVNKILAAIPGKTSVKNGKSFSTPAKVETIWFPSGA
jgi:hypothetical protein